MSQQLNFFNETGIDSKELDVLNGTAKNQNERIYVIMKQTGKKYTPFQLHTEYSRKYSAIPLTSIRRAMTVLTEQGKLKKLDKQKAERFGKRNFLWIAL